MSRYDTDHNETRPVQCLIEDFSQSGTEISTIEDIFLKDSSQIGDTLRRRLVNMLFDINNKRKEEYLKTQHPPYRNNSTGFRTSDFVQYAKLAIFCVLLAVISIHAYSIARHIRHERNKEYALAVKKINLSKWMREQHCENPEMREMLKECGFTDCDRAKEFSVMDPWTVANEALWEKSRINKLFETWISNANSVASYSGIALLAAVFMVFTHTCQHIIKRIIGG